MVHTHPFQVFFKPEKTRADRQHNIAAALLSEADSYSKEKRRVFVSVQKIRADIREALKLPVLSGEEHLGDLRAHGDALGGHGLNLHTERSKLNGKRYIDLSEKNIKKCLDFLEGNQPQDLWVD